MTTPDRRIRARIPGEYRTYRIAATVAPITFSGGVVRLRRGRFQRATTQINPINDAALRMNAAPTPAVANKPPPRPQPPRRPPRRGSPASRLQAQGRRREPD